jgi:hypothetical protein
MDQIHLTFETTLGDYEADFAPNEPLKAVKRRVLAGVLLDPDQADQFVVNFDERTLDDSKTVAELGLQSNDWLVVERTKAKA